MACGVPGSVRLDCGKCLFRFGDRFVDQTWTVAVDERFSVSVKWAHLPVDAWQVSVFAATEVGGAKLDTGPGGLL